MGSLFVFGQKKLMTSLVTLLLCCVVTAVSNPIVEMDSGKIMGTSKKVLREGKTVDVFLGIPYATPPVGALRYRRSTAPTPWKPDLLQATVKGPACMQFVPANPIPEWVARGSPQSEDCLYLNVWRPQRDPNKITLKAVVVWIHGGYLNYGSASMDLYDGAVLAAAGDVVVVSMNYRLGSFGFLAVRDGSDPSTGNQGLTDQLLALEWVRDHIARFGGDPKEVTIVGESAGAWSVGFHALSPIARSLFKRAIVQSGGVFANYLTKSVAEAIQRTLILAENLGCSTTSSDDIVGCLRNRTAREIALVEAFVCRDIVNCFSPIYGDNYLPSNPVSFSSLNISKDFLMGNVENEGSVFMSMTNWMQFPYRSPLNVTKYDMLYFFLRGFQSWPPFLVRQIYSMYTENVGEYDYPDLRAGLGNAFGDAFLRCPELFFAEKLSRDSRVFYYNMVYHSASQAARMDSWFGMSHFEDVQFVLGLPLRTPRNPIYSNADAQFSEEIINIWTTFAKTGNPPYLNGKPWPAFDTKSHQVMSLDLNNSGVETLRELKKCLFWKSLVASD